MIPPTGPHSLQFLPYSCTREDALAAFTHSTSTPTVPKAHSRYPRLSSHSSPLTLRVSSQSSRSSRTPTLYHHSPLEVVQGLRRVWRYP